jgi:hypothetical protein
MTKYRDVWEGDNDLGSMPLNAPRFLVLRSSNDRGVSFERPSEAYEYANSIRGRCEPGYPVVTRGG